MDVLIVGAGSMGTWFGAAVDADVAFADVDSSAATAAAESVGGRVADLDGTDRYDAVCIAVPMGYVTEAIEAHASRAQRAIVDVSGVMGPPLEAMEAHAPDREHASLHPLFAPERAPGSIPVVRGQRGPITDALLATLEAAGNDVFETTADEHDEAMETVQAATHTAVLAFALAAEPVPDGFGTPVYDGLEELVRTMTGGTPRVYADIQETFAGADAVAAAAERIAASDAQEFVDCYEEATQRWATALDDNSTEDGTPPDGKRGDEMR